MLGYINLILVVIIIVAVVVNMILLYKAKNDLNKRVDELNASIKTMSPTGGMVSLIDIAEFQKLSPEVKELYRKYVVQNIMPKVMTEANKMLIEGKMIDDLKIEGEALVQMKSEDMAKKYGGPFAIPKKTA